MNRLYKSIFAMVTALAILCGGGCNLHHLTCVAIAENNNERVEAMAQNETWLNHDLLNAVQVQYLDGNLFSQDNAGNLIGINLFRDGVPYSGGGSVSANVIRADGGTVSVVGALSGNVATVVLPQAAYAVPGVVSIVVKLTVSGQVTTIAAVVANVYQSSTDSAIDPGTIIPSVQTLIAAIDAAVASIPADYSALWTSLAPAFSTSLNYTAGQYVTYNGALYRFTTDHASGAWNSAHVMATNIGSDLNSLKSAFNYPEGDIKEISGMISRQMTRKNYSLSTGEEIAESATIKFIDGLIVPSSTLYIKCTNPNFNMFYLRYNKNGTYVNWSFVESTFGGHHAYLSGAYNYRIGVTRISSDYPSPTLADGKYIQIWERPVERLADLYSPNTLQEYAGVQNGASTYQDGEIKYTWVRENRRLGDGSVVENPITHNMITTVELVDCTSESLFVTNNSSGDLFLIVFNSDGTYREWYSSSDHFGAQYGWLPQGYKYYLLVTTGDLTESFKVRVFNSKKSVLHVPEDFSKIQGACTFAKDGDCILIKNGTYVEDVSVWQKNVTIIGESREYTIIKTTTDKYSQPPLEISKGSVRNITFYADDTDRASGESEDHAYAVHIDYPPLIGNTLEFVNCKFYAKNNSALGIGLRNNSKIRFADCYAVSQNSYGVFCHTQTNPEQTGTEQYIEFDDCIIESITWSKCVSLMSALGEGNDGHYISYNCIYKANGEAPTDYDRKTYQNTGGTFDIDPFSFGNNVSHMNGNKHN